MPLKEEPPPSPLLSGRNPGVPAEQRGGVRTEGAETTTEEPASHRGSMPAAWHQQPNALRKHLAEPILRVDRTAVGEGRVRQKNHLREARTSQPHRLLERLPGLGPRGRHGCPYRHDPAAFQGLRGTPQGGMTTLCQDSDQRRSQVLSSALSLKAKTARCTEALPEGRVRA